VCLSLLANVIYSLECVYVVKLYLLSNNDIKFVQDGSRDGEHIREWMFNRFKLLLDEMKMSYKILDGDYEKRFNDSIKIVNKLLII
jgi:HTH-type transcriptional repressor of NAD biosynthesis genes